MVVIKINIEIQPIIITGMWILYQETLFSFQRKEKVKYI